MQTLYSILSLEYLSNILKLCKHYILPIADVVDIISAFVCDTKYSLAKRSCIVVYSYDPIVSIF